MEDNLDEEFVEQHTKEIISTPNDFQEQTISGKISKRKREDIPNTSNKKERSIEDTHMQPSSKDTDTDELSTILEGMEDEISDALEYSASKNKLTRHNVKNILKHVITNEYVLAMVRNTMKFESGEKELEEAVFEPKLTRSKAKELSKTDCTLNWPVPSPMKKVDHVAHQLLEEEFPDESSDDEDYKPNEEEEPSDEDDTANSPRISDVWSPKTPASLLSPVPEVEKVLEHYAEDDNPLVIEMPTSTPSSEPTEADKIALRTRSKLCLYDTPLEEIEASFYAPDITIDMYDTACDDVNWLNFLNDLVKPIDPKLKAEPVNEVDDTEDDPEYTAQEDDDSPDPLDLAYGKATQISRKELNALMQEIHEYAQLEYGDDEEEEDHAQTQVPNESSESLFTSDEVNTDTCQMNSWSEWMNSDKKLQLDEQIRMYVQMLTQVYLLSHGTSELDFINLSTKLFLDEIKMFASREIGPNKKSVFYAHNLDGALSILNKYENPDVVHTKSKEFLDLRKAIPLHAKRTMATSKVFIYPQLLPARAFLPPTFVRKVAFSAAEDNLIALGLEQFSTCASKIEVIQKLLLPCKSVQQIKMRVKNCCSAKAPIDNPIKYYQVNKVAPPAPKIDGSFDPDKIKAPSKYPLEVLPKWMGFYCKVAMGHPLFALPNIAPSQPAKSPTQLPPPPAPPVAVVRPMFRKVPERKKPRLILPHGAVFSSLKHITPILKKYSQPKKPIPVIPFTVPCPYKDKCAVIPKRYSRTKSNSVPVIRNIKPKPVIEPVNCNNSPLKLESVATNTVTCPTINPTNFSSISTDQQSFTTIAQPAPILINATIPLQTAEANVLSVPNTCPTPVVVQTNSSPTNMVLNVVVPGPSTLPTVQGDVADKPNPADTIFSAADVDNDENIEDDEQDLPTIVTASSKKQTVGKKKNRIHKDLESSLALLKPTMVIDDPKKDEREILYVNSYLLRASECLKRDPETLNLFLMSICKYQNCTKFPVKLYLELKVILKDYPSLLDDFVAFLKPAEAKLVGKFKQYLVLNKIREFLRKIEVHFSNQPQHITKIVRALSQFRQQSYVTSVEALSGLQPLLRNQSHLMEELVQLLPDAAPPLYLQTDFEDIRFPNSDEDASSSGSWENITIPDAPDPYGGKDCPCQCHTQSADIRMLNRSRHCVKCGVKFIDGRIYLQTGKVLKPAQVTYHPLPAESNDNSSDKKNLQKSINPCEAFLKALAASERSNRKETINNKIDPAKESANNLISATICGAEAVPSISKLPCDVIEDTVFPSVVNPLNKTAPSDFSHLKDMIKSANETSENVSSETEEKNVSAQSKKWSGEEDKLIIYNCQRLGIRKEAFIHTANVLKSKTAEEVEIRFFSIVEQLFKKLPKPQT